MRPSYEENEAEIFVTAILGGNKFIAVVGGKKLFWEFMGKEIFVHERFGNVSDVLGEM